MVLSREGHLIFANQRALTLAASYFPSGAAWQSLPTPLRRWIAGSVPLEREKGGSVGEPLTIVKGPRTLSITRVTTRSETIVLFQETEIPAEKTPSARSLEALGVTKREAEVLLWIACGKTNFEIGVILEIALRTVKKHLDHIFEKLGVENRTTAAARAMETLRVNQAAAPRHLRIGLAKSGRFARRKSGSRGSSKRNAIRQRR